MARREEDPGARQTRQRIAQEAARLLSEHGGDDVAWARRKAAARLGVREESLLPGGEQILAELRLHRGLFGGGDGRDDLRRRREAALEAMVFFSDLEPRLVGAVLEGGSGDAPVRLHLHADDPDAVARMLLERGIPARQKSRPVRLERDRRTDVPAWSFEADGVAFELLQLPLASLRQPPRELLDDRAMERASHAALRRLLAAPAADD